DVSDKIRTEKISKLSSKLATKKIVRKFLVNLQREIGQSKNIVVEGRDMGTYVFPGADFKFYLDAKLEERAKRRHLQLQKNNIKIELYKIKEDLKKRDKQDMERKESPLHPALNAVIIDTTDMGKSAVVREILLCVGGSIE
ncbi:MAG: (d)CMP kinase, partial [Thermodesulfobacteriota bacterium]